MRSSVDRESSRLDPSSENKNTPVLSVADALYANLTLQVKCSSMCVLSSIPLHKEKGGRVPKPASHRVTDGGPGALRPGFNHHATHSDPSAGLTFEQHH